jgi:hypothetical protein
VFATVLLLHVLPSPGRAETTPWLQAFVHGGGGDVRSFLDSLRRRTPSADLTETYQALIDQMDAVDVANLMAWVRPRFTEPGLLRTIKDSLAIDPAKYVIAFTQQPELCGWLYGNMTATQFATRTDVTEQEYFDTRYQLRNAEAATAEYTSWKQTQARTPTKRPVALPKGQRRRKEDPPLPPLFTEHSRLYEQPVCPRFVGLEDGTMMRPGLGYRHQYHGHISRDRLIMVNLMDVQVSTHTHTPPPWPSPWHAPSPTPAPSAPAIAFARTWSATAGTPWTPPRCGARTPWARPKNPACSRAATAAWPR